MKATTKAVAQAFLLQVRVTYSKLFFNNFVANMRNMAKNEVSAAIFLSISEMWRGPMST